MIYFPIGRYISLMYRTQQAFFTHKTKSVDVSGGQLYFIFTLFSHPGLSQDEVAKCLELDKTTVTRAAIKMEKTGIITRKRDEQDHRVVRLYLTDKGILLFEELKNVSKEWYENLTQGLTEKDLTELERLLKVISENARNSSKGYAKTECSDEKD